MSTSTMVSAGTLALSLLFPFTALAHTPNDWYDAHERYSWNDVTTKRFGRTLPSYGGGVSIRANTPSTWVMRGDTMTYTLRMHNADARTHTVQVRAALDPETWAIAASHNGVLNGDVVYWDKVVLPAHTSTTFTIQARVNPGASLSRNVSLTAYLPGSSDIVETELREARYSDSLPYYYSYDARNRTAYPSPAFGRNVYFHPPMHGSNRNMFFGYVPAGPEHPCDSRFMRCY